MAGAPRGSVVFLHAHPDDEAIFTGGTIARLAASGWRVSVVVATSGELGVGTAGGLADLRAAETAAACAILGVGRLEMLGYLDSGLPGDPANHAPGAFFVADLAQAAARVAAVLAEERADALVLYDPAGIYGHPDHVKVHQVGMCAAGAAGVSTTYQATVDREYLHFVETHLVVDATAALPPGHGAAGLPSVLITTVVDVRDWLDVKRAAIAAHASQVPETSYAMTMPRASFADVYGFEWYVREGGSGPLEELAS